MFMVMVLLDAEKGVQVNQRKCIDFQSDGSKLTSTL